MAQQVQAKFVCRSKNHAAAVPDYGEVFLEAVTGGSPENDKFFNMTPSGQLHMGTLNTEVFSFFEPGKEYILNFTVAEAPEQTPISDEEF